MIRIFAIFLVLTTLYILIKTSPLKTTDISIPTVTPYQFPYKAPVIGINESYRIAIVGDSIVHTMGLNAEDLRQELIKRYPEKEFVTYNFGKPSTNVLTLYDRLQNEVLKEGFELIIIESFANNPLSEYSLEEGLKLQTEMLEKSVRLILKEKPGVAIAFMTPIDFDKENYAKGSRDLSPEVRNQWVEERYEYVVNHKQFAIAHGIPVIDVLAASLAPDGNLDPQYVSDDHIHPSEEGVKLISKTIADYIFENKILPE